MLVWRENECVFSLAKPSGFLRPGTEELRSSSASAFRNAFKDGRPCCLREGIDDVKIQYGLEDKEGERKEFKEKEELKDGLGLG